MAVDGGDVSGVHGSAVLICYVRDLNPAGEVPVGWYDAGGGDRGCLKEFDALAHVP